MYKPFKDKVLNAKKEKHARYTGTGLLLASVVLLVIAVNIYFRVDGFSIKLSTQQEAVQEALNDAIQTFEETKQEAKEAIKVAKQTERATHSGDQSEAMLQRLDEEQAHAKQLIEQATQNKVIVSEKEVELARISAHIEKVEQAIKNARYDEEIALSKLTEQEKRQRSAERTYTALKDKASLSQLNSVKKQVDKAREHYHNAVRARYEADDQLGQYSPLIITLFKIAAFLPFFIAFFAGAYYLLKAWACFHNRCITQPPPSREELQSLIDEEIQAILYGKKPPPKVLRKEMWGTPKSLKIIVMTEHKAIFFQQECRDLLEIDRQPWRQIRRIAVHSKQFFKQLDIEFHTKYHLDDWGIEGEKEERSNKWTINISPAKDENKGTTKEELSRAIAFLDKCEREARQDREEWLLKQFDARNGRTPVVQKLDGVDANPSR